MVLASGFGVGVALHETSSAALAPAPSRALQRPAVNPASTVLETFRNASLQPTFISPGSEGPARPGVCHSCRRPAADQAVHVSGAVQALISGTRDGDSSSISIELRMFSDVSLFGGGLGIEPISDCVAGVLPAALGWMSMHSAHS